MKLHLIKAYSKVLWLFLNPSTRKFNISNSVKDVMNVSYSNLKGNHYKLDIHYPENASGPLPIVVYIHGGGWVIGDKSSTRGYCRKLADSGYLVFNVNYGLGPKYTHPDPLHHIIAAIDWIKENCARYNGDPNKFFLAGESAGAHLASLITCICTNEKLEKDIDAVAPLTREQLKGAVLFCGAFDFDTALESGFPLVKESIMGYTGSTDLKKYPLAGQVSPLHHVTENYPPVFLTSGEVDPLHKSQTMAMIQKLDSQGVEHEELLYDGTVAEASHGFHIFAKRKTAMEALDALTDFMKRKTSDKSQPVSLG
ncbi:alpha/beta hydrolase [uncultured Planococcus sp.]|uniref:alpha/beta hydrolase n=1 Tax=uncultured Planococcus sp. TaxID=337815 RepID=UPI00261EC5FE|nr:alpha/beta hydrolase [uncultured Planococcus sp.]